MNCSPPGSSVHGVFQARILEWLPFPFPGDLPYPGVEPTSPTLQAGSLQSEPPGKPRTLPVIVAQLYLTLCNLKDCSPSGSSFHGVFQARILEWVTISISRGSSQLSDQTCVSCISCIDRFFIIVSPGKNFK